MEEEDFLFVAAAHLHQEFGEIAVSLPVAEQVFQGAALRLHGFRVALEVDQRFQNGRELVRRKGTGTVRKAEGHVIDGQFNQFAVQGYVILHVFLLFLRMMRYRGACAMYRYPARTSCGMWRQKKVRSRVRMWAPSTSASVMMMILW